MKRSYVAPQSKLLVLQLKETIASGVKTHAQLGFLFSTGSDSCYDFVQGDTSVSADVFSSLSNGDEEAMLYLMDVASGCAE